MSMKINMFLAINIALVTLFFNGCFDDDIENNIIAGKNNKHTTIGLLTTNKKKITASLENNIWSFSADNNLQNKVILVNFWATWCPPCMVEIPHFLKIREKHKNDFEIIGVLMEQNKNIDSLNEFISKYKITYPVTISAQNFILADAMGGSRGLPTSYLIDKKGKIVQVYKGAIPPQMLNSDIAKAIE